MDYPLDHHFLDPSKSTLLLVAYTVLPLKRIRLRRLLHHRRSVWRMTYCGIASVPASGRATQNASRELKDLHIYTGLSRL
ncbi:unnamed protein product [Dibothriocephalus latus]|uniref:Uncharacterized protein n=1 Tax=Dibothriocephalus latus TaxID=60516 RepID=A0A3P7N879_DIBLA|nr:unnamed protein product [Dibothriocephalus latus]